MQKSSSNPQQAVSPVPERTSGQGNPASSSEKKAWPGKSEPGHIKPIGPAYRSGRKAPSTEGHSKT
jgi:hypothetical protein